MEEITRVWSTAGDVAVTMAHTPGDNLATIATVDAGEDGVAVVLDRDGALRLMLALADFIRNS
jgi:hypothetical protein